MRAKLAKYANWTNFFKFILKIKLSYFANTTTKINNEFLSLFTYIFYQKVKT